MERSSMGSTSSAGSMTAANVIHQANLMTLRTSDATSSTGRVSNQSDAYRTIHSGPPFGGVSTVSRRKPAKPLDLADTPEPKKKRRHLSFS